MVILRKARVAVTPRSWLLKRALSNGVVVCGRNRAGHGVRGLYIYGDALEPELAHIENLLPADAVFIDVGANTGMYTLKAARHLQAGTVVAVEPGIESLTMLAGNVRRNALTNVRLRHVCVAERTGEQVLWLNGNKPNAFSLIQKFDDAARSSVLGVSLDDLCAWERLTRVDYVKIDVAGGEERVVAGAARMIAEFRPILQIAVNPFSVDFALSGYSAYQFPLEHPDSTVLIADGDARRQRFEALGWRRCGRAA